MTACLRLASVAKSLADQELPKGSEEMVDHWVPHCQPDWLLVTALWLGGDG